MLNRVFERRKIRQFSDLIFVLDSPYAAEHLFCLTGTKVLLLQNGMSAYADATGWQVESESAQADFEFSLKRTLVPASIRKKSRLRKVS